MGDLRDQYISKIPSSAFLTLAPDLLKEGSVYVAQLSTVDGGRDAFITEARSLVIENDEATTHVDVLQNLEDPSQWMVIEAYKRGGGPARDAQGKLSGFLKRTEKLMSVPEDMSELEMMVESPDLAEKRDLTTVYLEQVQCKPGIGMDDKLIEATRTLSRAVGGHTTAPDTPSTTTTTSPASTMANGSKPDALRVVPPSPGTIAALEMVRDKANRFIFSLFLHCRSANDAMEIRQGRDFQAWAEAVAPYLDGGAKVYYYRSVIPSADKSPIPVRAAVPSAELKRLPVRDSSYWEPQSDGTAVIMDDENLLPYSDELKKRYQSYLDYKNAIVEKEGSLERFAQGYRLYGFNRVEGGSRGKGWLLREWLPAAKAVTLMGDFNDWNRESHPLVSDDFGRWTLFLPDDRKTGEWALQHKCKVKLHIQGSDDEWFDRIPAWTRLAWHSATTNLFDAIIWTPKTPEKYTPKHPRPPRPSTLKIYEAHVGVSSLEEKIGTYVEFIDEVLPRVARLGYNAILLIGVQEHAYYASMGFHPTNLFAPSSRFGSPEELKQLIDIAHGYGLVVMMDVVHCHVSTNALDGLNLMDGSEGCYLHEGLRGLNPAWDCRLFNYKQWEVTRFLLSNLRYFIDEFMVDGFRFVGVTSMIYKHQGICAKFTGDYAQYFGFDSDEEAITYLTLANELVHTLLPDHGITIAEETSNIPTLCKPVAKGGIGFDYRLAMEKANAWRLLAKRRRDEEWDFEELVQTLTGRRKGEKCITMVESKEQCLTAKRPLLVAMFAWESLHTHAVGGVAPHVTELAAGLQRLGHEVHVFVRTTQGGNSHRVFYGVHYHECQFGQNNDFVQEMVNMCDSFVWSMDQSENFMNETYQITHAHDWLAGKALAKAKLSGHRAVMTMHSTEFGRCGNNAYGGQSGRIRDIEAEACHVSDRVICVSGVLAQEVVGQYGIHEGKIKVIYNGIHAEQFDGEEDAGAIKGKYGIGAMEPTILFVGRMAVQKGPDLLVEAIPMILNMRNDCKFLMVGDGHMKAGLEGRTQQLGVGHAVRWLGKKGGGELKSLFKACDAVVVPSRNEPFGIVVLEAWSASKPVVATTCGGPRDFVSPDNDGWLVDPEPGSIAWGVCEILKNFAHSQWMGTRGRVKAAFNFSWDTIARQTRDVYYEQMNRHDAPYASYHLGDATLAHVLMGSAMYNNMGVFDPNEGAARGLALHKMIRLFGCGLGGDGYMTFMGNEFGHPEWIDMPRAGNGWSHSHARRRWDLADNKDLKFKNFEFFEACLLRWESKLQWMAAPSEKLIVCMPSDKVVAFERGPCLFLFNFHPTAWYSQYRIGTSSTTPLLAALDTDEGRFGGLDRHQDAHLKPFPIGEGWNECDGSILVDLPARTGLVLAPVDVLEKARRTAVKGEEVLAMDVDDFVSSLPRWKIRANGAAPATSGSVGTAIKGGVSSMPVGGVRPMKNGF
ncbi:unnamed protein product [Vitrella brassicaformis CCMP3155]|uniref:Uncharacterized protein n=3 Tax=Vitrella brassicaformis TaxID=1169539 RepID=A0A0G4EG74_VITBC|nr:unnamed protein product [Vitrella brassicaformis CCMP3155]|eukprot:CEL94386.1 unnamed protein product [Vitrella brassicaformis CCMP3155]